jgi:hypothetical protein
MSRPDPRNVCDGCRVSFDRRLRSHTELGPMLHDDIWQQIATPASGFVGNACLNEQRVLGAG